MGEPASPRPGFLSDFLAHAASGDRAADTNNAPILPPESTDPQLEQRHRVTKGEGLEHARLQRLLAMPECAHLQNWSRTLPIALEVVEIGGLPITGKNLKILVDRVETASGKKCPRDCKRLECLNVDWLHKHRQHLVCQPPSDPPSSPSAPAPIPPVPAPPAHFVAQPPPLPPAAPPASSIPPAETEIPEYERFSPLSPPDRYDYFPESWDFGRPPSRDFY
jgi:hypothetical protein